MVINGDQLRRNPSEVISAVQDFMNLEQVIKEENFVTVRKSSDILCVLGRSADNKLLFKKKELEGFAIQEQTSRRSTSCLGAVVN